MSQQIAPVVHGYHENPFEVLGPHEIEESGRRAVAVRAYSPEFGAGLARRPEAGAFAADAADPPGGTIRSDLCSRSHKT